MRRTMITVATAAAAFTLAAPVAEAGTVHAASNWTLKGPMTSVKAWGTAKKWSSASTEVTPHIKARGHGWKTELKLVGSGSTSTITISVGGTVHPRSVVVVGKKVKARLCVKKRGMRTVCGGWKTIYKRR